MCKEGILRSLLTSISRGRGALLDVQARSSHAAQAIDDQATGLFSPQTLLSVDISDARIFTYGYSADVVGGFLEGAGKNSISQHANDLMVELASELQDNVARCPLIKA